MLYSQKEIVKGRWYYVALRVQEFKDKNATFDLFIDGKFDSQGSLW